MKYAGIYLLALVTLIGVRSNALTITLDPAGDNVMPGRSVGNAFEAGLTLACAEHIQCQLSSSTQTVFITRARSKPALLFPERQSFANRLESSLYVSISFFTASQPTIMIYYYCMHPVTDFWQFPYASLSLVPYEQVHRRSLAQSITIAEHAIQYLQHHTHVALQGPYGIPIPELQGLTCPGIKCEIGLTEASQWQHYSTIIAAFLQEVLATL